MYIQSSEIGKMASSVYITASHRHSHIMVVYTDRPCCISCYRTNIDNNINTVENIWCYRENFFWRGNGIFARKFGPEKISRYTVLQSWSVMICRHSSIFSSSFSALQCRILTKGYYVYKWVLIFALCELLTTPLYHRWAHRGRKTSSAGFR